jgi:hypothetical protein
MGNDIYLITYGGVYAGVTCQFGWFACGCRNKRSETFTPFSFNKLVLRERISHRPIPNSRKVAILIRGFFLFMASSFKWSHDFFGQKTSSIGFVENR